MTHKQSGFEWRADSRLMALKQPLGLHTGVAVMVALVQPALDACAALLPDTA